MNQNAKADAGKLEIDLVPMQIVRDIAEVRMYGRKKYGSAENWRSVELRRYINALLRHTLAFANDIYSKDEESGIPHYKHMECNLAFISELIREAEANGRVCEQIEVAEGIKKTTCKPKGRFRALWTAFRCNQKI